MPGGQYSTTNKLVEEQRLTQQQVRGVGLVVRWAYVVSQGRANSTTKQAWMEAAHWRHAAPLCASAEEVKEQVLGLLAVAGGLALVAARAQEGEDATGHLQQAPGA